MHIGGVKRPKFTTIAAFATTPVAPVKASTAKTYRLQTFSFVSSEINVHFAEAWAEELQPNPWWPTFSRFLLPINQVKSRIQYAKFYASEMVQKCPIEDVDRRRDMMRALRKYCSEREISVGLLSRIKNGVTLTLTDRYRGAAFDGIAFPVFQWQSGGHTNSSSNMQWTIGTKCAKSYLLARQQWYVQCRPWSIRKTSNQMVGVLRATGDGRPYLHPCKAIQIVG